MLSSLSTVPPVWPSARPAIIGTKPPQAATIGATIRLVLPPTPPVEWLSRSGPGRAWPLPSSTPPERFIARVSAVVRGRAMRGKNPAMAKAAIWPSAIEPSRKPRTKAAIWSSPSSAQSRLRRMISWGMNIALEFRLHLLVSGSHKPSSPGLTRRSTLVAHAKDVDARIKSGRDEGSGILRLRASVVHAVIGHLAAEGGDQAGEIAGGALGDGERLGVGGRIRRHSLGQVGDDRDGADAQSAMAREDHLGHRRHPDGVAAEDPEGADLGRRLEARPATGKVGSLGEIDRETTRVLPHPGTQNLAICVP